VFHAFFIYFYHPYFEGMINHHIASFSIFYECLSLVINEIYNFVLGVAVREVQSKTIEQGQERKHGVRGTV